MRLKHRKHFGPRRDGLELSQKAISPRELFLACLLQFRKTRLHRVALAEGGLHSDRTANSPRAPHE
jgi:hypothetical protein